MIGLAPHVRPTGGLLFVLWLTLLLPVSTVSTHAQTAAAVGIDEKEILGSYSAAADIQDTAADLILKKQLPVMNIVTHRFPLARIQEGLELAARPTVESLKILITHQ